MLKTLFAMLDACVSMTARIQELERLRWMDDRMLEDIGISRREAMLGRPIGRSPCAAGSPCRDCLEREPAFAEWKRRDVSCEYAHHS
jgi:uncharacterized protein YjiS (DUF1127 family)